MQDKLNLELLDAEDVELSSIVYIYVACMKENKNNWWGLSYIVILVILTSWDINYIIGLCTLEESYSKLFFINIKLFKSFISLSTVIICLTMLNHILNCSIKI